MRCAVHDRWSVRRKSHFGCPSVRCNSPAIFWRISITRIKATKILIHWQSNIIAVNVAAYVRTKHKVLVDCGWTVEDLPYLAELLEAVNRMPSFPFKLTLLPVPTAAPPILGLSIAPFGSILFDPLKFWYRTLQKLPLMFGQEPYI